MISLNTGKGGHGLALRFDDLPPNVDGEASCFLGRIEFDYTLAFAPAGLRATATHELGHLIGLGHSPGENVYGDVPTMATCISADKFPLAQDDWAATANVWESATYKPFHANTSFEHGVTHWRQGGSTEWNLKGLADGGFSERGNQYLRFGRSAGTAPRADRGYIYQYSNVLVPQAFDAALFVRKLQGGDKGRVVTSITWQGQLFGMNDDCDGVINNYPSEKTAYMEGPSMAVEPTTTWTGYQTNNDAITCSDMAGGTCNGFGDPTFVGSAIRITVRNALRADGPPPPPKVAVDDVRVRGQFG